MACGIDDLVGSLVSSGCSAAGDIAGNFLGSAYGAHLSRDLMSRQSTINRELWNESLLNGPSLQRQGLEDAGYNPLLALSGFNVPEITGVSIPSGYHSAISNLGSNAVSSAREAMKAKAGVANVKTDTELKGAQKEVAKEEVEVKKAQKEELESQKDLNKARETQTNVETVSDPVRVAKDVAIGAGTAYGAHKISKRVAEITSHKLPSLTKAQEEAKKETLKRIKVLKKWNDKLIKKTSAPAKAVDVLKNSGVLALPLALGLGTAYGLHKLYEKSGKNSNVRRLMDNPIRSPHF